MKKNRHQFIALAVVIIFGITLFYVGTDGFTAFTEETARTNKLIEEQPQLPVLTLEDSKERTYNFDEFSGKYLFMTFIYTSCTTVCMELEMNVAEVYEGIPEKYIGEDIMFLSLSFDPTVDTPEVLERYRTYFGSDGEQWRMARIPDEEEMQLILDEFGVIVIPDDEGDYQHNVAFYLVDPNGSLVDVLEFSDIAGAQDRIIEVLEQGVEG